MSTLFWAGRAKQVVSVEDEEQWFAKVAASVPANVTLTLETDLSRFPDTIRRAGTFDVIVVDGPARGRTRLKCCRAALDCLGPGGMIILDNSDWLPESSQLLRESGLLEVDFTGFAPICGHVQTTSLYFTRAFEVPPAHGRLPMPGTGSVAKVPGNGPGAGARRADRVRRYEPFPVLSTMCRSRRLRRRAAPVPGDQLFRFGRRSLLLAILDLDRQRVLLSRHCRSGP